MLHLDRSLKSSKVTFLFILVFPSIPPNAICFRRWVLYDDDLFVISCKFNFAYINNSCDSHIKYFWNKKPWIFLRKWYFLKLTKGCDKGRNENFCWANKEMWLWIRFFNIKHFFVFTRKYDTKYSYSILKVSKLDTLE